MRSLPSNCSEMRWARWMVSGNSERPLMYISSLGSSLRVTSTGKVLVSLTPNERPRSEVSLIRRSNIGTASAHWRSSRKCLSSKAM